MRIYNETKFSKKIMYKMFCILSISLLVMLGTVEAATTTDLPTRVEVKENQDPGTVVQTFTVTGANSPQLILSATITNYLKVVDNNKTACTKLNCATYDLVTTVKIDREKIENGFIQFYYKFTDGTQGNTVLLMVIDENDEKPFFKNQPYKATIPENFAKDSVIPNLNIIAEDKDQNSNFEYKLMPAGQNSDGIENYMKIKNIHSGNITVVKELDYEKRNFYEYLVEVFDGKFRVNASVWIQIKDIQDMPPAFTSSSFVLDINENARKGDFVTNVKAEDQDRGIPNPIGYEISSDSCSAFSINKDSGNVTVDIDKLDREDRTIDNLSGVCTVQIKAYEILKNNSEGASIMKDITIFVKDLNDNVPFFNYKSFTATVNENTTKNNPVTLNATITVKDLDTVKYSKFKLSLKTLADKAFTALKVTPLDSVTETNVFLSVNDPSELDYEKIERMEFKIVAEDKDSAKTSEARVTLDILPVNEYPPKFTQPKYQANVTEGKDIDNVIQITATDDDKGKDGKVTYTLYDDNFKINNTTGVISVSKLDYEKRNFYSLTVEAADGGGWKATVNVDVFVQDINDESPVFKPKFYTGLLREGKHSFEYEVTVKATDADKPDSSNSKVDYSITSVSQGLSNSFSINVQNGSITPSSIDFENLTDTVIQLEVTASDNGIPVNKATAHINITVLDVNDNAPKFQQNAYHKSIKENLTLDSLVLNVKADDADKSQQFNKVTYRLNPYTSIFRINLENGSIFLSSLLDREKQSTYQLTIEAFDGGSPPKTATTKVFVTVEDVNDETPRLILGKQNIELYENMTVGSFITSINATDEDLDNNLTFNISQETIEIDGKGREVNQITKHYFEINMATGDITLKEKLDREKFERILLTVEVTDQNTAEGDKTDTGHLKIIIKDINDCYPVFTENSTSLNLVENYPLNSIIATLTATDDDKNDSVTYKIIDGFNTFGINDKTGEISLKKSLDRETESQITFKVVASDSLLPTLSSTATVFVNVTDFNDNDPEFQNLETLLPVPENTSVNSTIVKITATDKDIGDHANIIYTLGVPGGNSPFKMDKITGDMTLISELDREKVDKYTVIITAQDNYDNIKGFLKPGWRENTTTIIIEVTDVNDNPPEFTNNNYVKKIPENTFEGFILTVATNDKDIGNNSKVQYSLQGEESRFFKMDNNTGDLGIKLELTNKVGVKCFNVTATDQGVPPLNSTASICINVTDINNNNPLFEKTNDSITIPESTCPETILYTVNITDLDVGDNAKFKFELEKTTDSSYFTIDENGQVILENLLDYEKQISYQVKIKASDKGKPSRTSIPAAFSLLVNVNNTNDETPEFGTPNQTLEIKEGAPKIEVGMVKAKDSGFDLCYKIDDTLDADYFTVKNDSNAALIETKKEVDYEHRNSLNLVVVALNCIEVKFNASCSKSPPTDKYNTQIVNVVILDVNDNPPIFTESTFSEAIMYDISNKEQILDLAYFVKDADSDPQNKQHEYFIESFKYFGNDALKQLKTPFVIRDTNVYRKADFDSSVSGYIEMTIKVNDSDGLSNKTTLKIHILSETNEVKILFKKPIEEVRQTKSDFIKFLQLVVGDTYEIIPGKLDVPKNDKGHLDDLRTNMVVYAIDNNTKSVLPPEKLLEILDKQRVLNVEQFKQFAVEEVRESEPPKTEEDSEKSLIIFIVVIVLLALILIIMILLFAASVRRYNRKLRAAETNVIPPPDAEVKFPGTNMFSEGRINPLYNNLDEVAIVSAEKGSFNSDVYKGDIYSKNINNELDTQSFDGLSYSMAKDNSKLDLDNVIKEHDAERNNRNINSMIPNNIPTDDVDVQATEV